MDRLEQVRMIVDHMLSNLEDAQEQRAGYVHLYGVAQLCTLLAMRRNLDLELCSVIGMLHDYSSYRHNDSTNHASVSSVEAERVLRESGSFRAEETELAVNAIGNHSAKTMIHDGYSELLKDADSFQAYLYNPLAHLNDSGLGSIDGRTRRVRRVMDELGITAQATEPVQQAAGADT